MSIVGSGYGGTTIAACFVDLGHEVINIDIDENVVDAFNSGTAPIHEDGLADLISEHTGEHGSIEATTDYETLLDTDVTFLCLPTPQNDDGSIDLSIMRAGAEQVGKTLAEKEDCTPSSSRVQLSLAPLRTLSPQSSKPKLEPLPVRTSASA